MPRRKPLSKQEMIEVFKMAFVHNLQGVGRIRMSVRREREDLRIDKISIADFIGSKNNLREYI
jgi:hypothetical protein